METSRFLCALVYPRQPILAYSEEREFGAELNGMALPIRRSWPGATVSLAAQRGNCISQTEELTPCWLEKTSPGPRTVQSSSGLSVTAEPGTNLTSRGSLKLAVFRSNRTIMSFDPSKR